MALPVAIAENLSFPGVMAGDLMRGLFASTKLLLFASEENPVSISISIAVTKYPRKKATYGSQLRVNHHGGKAWQPEKDAADDITPAVGEQLIERGSGISKLKVCPSDPWV